MGGGAENFFIRRKQDCALQKQNCGEN